MGNNLPEIAEAFRTTGRVCFERNLRILNKSRASKCNSPEKIAEQVKSMGATFSHGSKSLDGKFSGSLQQKRVENMNVLKEIQKENSAALMQTRVKILKTVLAKNKQLVDSVPGNIAPDEIKRDFLKMRKNLMIRLIHSELRNKKVGEWTFKSMHKI